jgi:hypothetical protein
MSWKRFFLRGIGYATAGTAILAAGEANQRKADDFKRKFPNVKVPTRLQYVPLVGFISTKDYPTEAEAKKLETEALQQQRREAWIAKSQ